MTAYSPKGMMTYDKDYQEHDIQFNFHQPTQSEWVKKPKIFGFLPKSFFISD